MASEVRPNSLQTKFGVGLSFTLTILAVLYEFDCIPFLHHKEEPHSISTHELHEELEGSRAKITQDIAKAVQPITSRLNSIEAKLKPLTPVAKKVKG
ncbi:MAG: hypothetical protein ACOYON_02435 [Fimbriimonas sp.]